MKKLKLGAKFKYAYNKMDILSHLQLKSSVKFDFYICIVSLSIVLFVTGYLIKFIYSEALIDTIIKCELDYDAFRRLKISANTIDESEKKMKNIIKQNPRLRDVPFVDNIGYITLSMMAADYDLVKNDVIDTDTFLRGIARVSGSQCFQELYKYYHVIFNDSSCFPVPKAALGNADISYEDTWYVLRSYGGSRKHEGTDLVASNNERGYFPIISMSDGIVENMGWLEKGGNRVGIRSVSGGYYYYAHLHSYAPGIKEGDSIIAGQLVGFMGDTGYGSEGTMGMFDVHLHLGIYIQNEDRDMSINPYYLLRILETDRYIVDFTNDN